MALRDQPYFPLYVQDFISDEKLIECSAEATGVFIRLMCSMHKSEYYGKILLKQKFKQHDNQIRNFASQLAKHFPFDVATIENGISELLSEKVITMDGDYIIQKRMVHDFELSVIRSQSGKKGGKSTQSKIQKEASDFAQAKSEASTESEIVIENANEIVTGIGKEGKGEKPKRSRKPSVEKATKHVSILFLEEDWKPFLNDKHGQDYYYTASTRNSLKEIKLKLIHEVKSKCEKQGVPFVEADTDRLVREAWQFLLNNYKHWSKFHQGLARLEQINHFLPNIISDIKNQRGNAATGTIAHNTNKEQQRQSGLTELRQAAVSVLNGDSKEQPGIVGVGGQQAANS